MIVLYCNSLLTKHVTHYINIMQKILKGHNVFVFFGTTSPFLKLRTMKFLFETIQHVINLFLQLF
jgi:hypothetical protein